MKRIVSLVLTVMLLVMLSATPTMAEVLDTVQLPEQEGAVVLTSRAVEADASAPLLAFVDLRDTMEDNNYMVRSLKAQLDDLQDMDLSELDGAVGMLEQLAAGLNTTQTAVNAALSQLQKLPEVDPNLILTYNALSATLKADTILLDSQIASLESQIESAESSVELGQDTIYNAIDQMVKGAETLYIGIATMENAVADIQRGLDTLDRAVAIYETQLELGMASEYDVESMKYQRTSVASQMEALKFQIKTSKIMLEGLCGMEINGNVRLGELALPTAEEISGVDYDGTLYRATQRNLDVISARAENDADDDDDAATSYAVHAAEDTFAYNYKITCLTVGEKQRLVEMAGETVAFQERTFEITAKKYELGMISYEEYMAGQSELLQAKSDLYTAQLELFSAYRNYVWARDKGIV